MVASTATVPTGHMVTHPDTALPAGATLTARVAEVTRSSESRYLDAATLAERLLGSTTTANIIVLGTAIQIGAVPIGVEHVERAIELNGVAVAANLAALRWGRRWADDPAAVEIAAGLAPTPAADSLDQLVDRLADDLIQFQSARYAMQYRGVVEHVRESERAVDPGSEAVTAAVARNLHRQMAYKDEYEVARLLLAPEAQRAYQSVGGPRTTVTHHLHPPMLRSLGLDHKLALQRTAGPALKALRSMKGVRGTLLDPFRWAEVRRVERAMIPEYVAAVEQLCRRLGPANLAEAAAIAELPDQVRGYEDLKLRRAGAYRTELADRLARFG
jgi:indolepyruvate ferredoxin oxidoreductase